MSKSRTPSTPWLAARNILAVRLDNIGDVVMLGPALRAIKETAPDACITLLASPAGSTAAPLLPWVDDVIVWRAVWQDLGNLTFDPARERELVALLAARAFDAALIFTSFSQTPHAPGYVCYLAGIPLRAGESKEFGGAVLSTELRGAPDTLHQAERNLRLVEHLGFPVCDRDLAIAISDASRGAAGSVLRDLGFDPDAPFVLLHPGASAKARRYPAERYGEVARLLGERGYPVVVTGIEREAELLSTVIAGAPQARLLIGQTTLAEYAALVERAALVICNDTLPMHLADATRTPAVVLYSGTEYESQWQPRATHHRLLIRATPCQPCYRFECPIGLPCLDIPPCEVVEAAEEMLASRLATGCSQTSPTVVTEGLRLQSLPARATARVGMVEREAIARAGSTANGHNGRTRVGARLAPPVRPTANPQSATGEPRTGAAPDDPGSRRSSARSRRSGGAA